MAKPLAADHSSPPQKKLLFFSRYVGHAPAAILGSSAAEWPRVGLECLWPPYRWPGQCPAGAEDEVSSGGGAWGPGLGPPAPLLVLASSAVALRVWGPSALSAGLSPGPAAPGAVVCSRGTPTREETVVTLSALCTSQGGSDFTGEPAAAAAAAATAAAASSELPQSVAAAAPPPSRGRAAVLPGLGENLRRASAARQATQSGVHLATFAPTPLGRAPRPSADAAGAAGGAGGAGGLDCSPPTSATAGRQLTAVTADGSDARLHWWRLAAGGQVSFVRRSSPPPDGGGFCAYGGVVALLGVGGQQRGGGTDVKAGGGPATLLVMHQLGVCCLWDPASVVCLGVVPCPVLSLGCAFAASRSLLVAAGAPDRGAVSVARAY